MFLTLCIASTIGLFNSLPSEVNVENKVELAGVNISLT
jgi:hypothetical protein